jgi:hypothetical protein
MKNGVLDTLLNAYYSCLTQLTSWLHKESKQRPEFYEARSVILTALDLIAYEDTPAFKQLPWLHNHKKGLQNLSIHKNYIRDQWRAYRRPGISANILPGQFNRWDILSLYGDYPLPAYFDYDRFIHDLDPDLQSEILTGRHLEGFQTIAGSCAPGLFEIVKKVVQLQCRWASDTFIQPLDFKSGKGYHGSLYSFSGYLLDGLLILVELIRVIQTGVIFHQSYDRQLISNIEDFLNQQPPAPMGFADLFFLHHAVWKIWLSLGGDSLNAAGRQRLDSFLSTFLIDYRECSCLIEVFQRLFVNNPVTIMMGLDFFSDMDLLAHEEGLDEVQQEEDGTDKENQSVGEWNPGHMARLFHFPLCRENLCQMADYLYDGLMGPIPQEAATCFCTSISGSPRQLFGNRLDAIVHMINATLGKHRDSQESQWVGAFFWIYFFNLLLHEWLSSKKNTTDTLPLPPLKQPLVPGKVRLSHFYVNAARKEDVAAIRKAMDEGVAFSELAKKYGQDHSTRAFGGEIGWVASRNLPGAIHVEKLLGRKIDTPFFVIKKQKHHYYIIHEFEFGESSNFFEQVIEQANMAGGERFRQTTVALFEALDKTITSSRHLDQAEADLVLLNDLSHKAKEYIDLVRKMRSKQ